MPIVLSHVNTAIIVILFAAIIVILFAVIVVYLNRKINSLEELSIYAESNIAVLNLS